MRKYQVVRLALAGALLAASPLATATTPQTKTQEKRVIQPAKSSTAGQWLDRLFRRLGVTGSVGIFGIPGITDVNSGDPAPDPLPPCVDGVVSTDPCVRSASPIGG